ncbi:NADH dehydrogenase [ubiquinone] iron-sulfur protein 5 isoform X3 [Phyllostomus hastatus]|uniref:NADH dehydrogenase [ubiquinone] iron-sulfur protein 5 isoform X3 n=1 Tax=Phyllostomus hastatus TaxID=9423 RepID=UPI001E680BE4|nr:NADH dehydrogenase [ubiquinone] iron-sulfur protein 5 isoform X3 [Phyllostomus hastatus]
MLTHGQYLQRAKNTAAHAQINRFGSCGFRREAAEEGSTLGVALQASRWLLSFAAGLRVSCISSTTQASKRTRAPRQDDETTEYHHEAAG